MPRSKRLHQPVAVPSAMPGRVLLPNRSYSQRDDLPSGCLLPGRLVGAAVLTAAIMRRVAVKIVPFFTFR